MAGSATPEPTNGAKRSVDFQLNMVPFIDLLSVLITFLLMTSVWTQIGRIDVEQGPSHGQIDGTPQAPDDGPSLTISIKGSGYAIGRRGLTVTDIPKVGDAYAPAALEAAMTSFVIDHPDEHAVVVSSEDNVPYEALIHVMDICLLHRLTAITVAGVDG